MKVIVTGGTGLLGRALSRRLSQDGDEVVILSRSGRKPDDLPEPVRIVQWDAATGNGWSDELNGTDVIVNLAGENLADRRWSKGQKEQILNSRLNAGRAIIDAVERSGHAPRRLLQGSGSNYYGHRPDKYLTESEPPGEDFLASVCMQWEKSTAPLEQAGTSRAILRTAVVLSATEGALPRIALPFRLFVGGYVGRGDQGLSWIHLQDHVEAMRFLIREPSITGPINMSSPNPVNNYEFSKGVGRALGRSMRFRAPVFAIRLAFGEMADTVLKGNFLVPKRLIDAGFQFRFPWIDDALRDVLGSATERREEATTMSV